MQRLIHSLASLAALALASGAHAQNQTPAIEAIVPEGMERIVESFTYSPAVRAGDFVFLAGFVASLPADENGEMVPATEENLIAAYESAFQQIERVLNEAGASWRDVVEMTTYHKDDLRGQVDAFLVVKNRYQAEPYPAWTAIDIDRLYPDRGVTEITVVAYAPRERE